MVLKQLDIHKQTTKQNKNHRPLLHIQTKINSNYIIDLNVNVKQKIVLKENIGENL